MRRTLIIGCGNADRGDDSAGILVARLLCARGVAAINHTGDGLSLLDLWTEDDDVVLIDATVSGSTPGNVTEWHAASAIPSILGPGTSTHGFDIGQTIELARVLDRLPRSLVFIGIEGARFELGQPPSEAVCEAVERVAATLAARSLSS